MPHRTERLKCRLFFSINLSVYLDYLVSNFSLHIVGLHSIIYFHIYIYIYRKAINKFDKMNIYRGKKKTPRKHPMEILCFYIYTHAHTHTHPPIYIYISCSGWTNFLGSPWSTLTIIFHFDKSSLSLSIYIYIY